jgi:hypothetical protein
LVFGCTFCILLTLAALGGYGIGTDGEFGLLNDFWSYNTNPPSITFLGGDISVGGDPTFGDDAFPGARYVTY